MQRALRLWAFFGLVGVDALGGLQYLNKAVHGLQSVGVQSSRPDQYTNGHFSDEYPSNMVITQDFINRQGIREPTYGHHDMVHDASDTMLAFGDGEDQLGRVLSDDPAQAKEQEVEALLEAAKAGVGKLQEEEDFDLTESMPGLMTEI